MKPKRNYVLGPQDNCQTPSYGITPLLPYLRQFDLIWEPACGEGLLVESIRSIGVQVIPTDIQIGIDFLAYEPDDYDAIVTNPPYSNPWKYKFLARCYELGAPFALLMPVDVLGAKTAQVLFDEHGIEVIFLDQRIDFKMPNLGYDGHGAQFPVAWFTWKLNIGRQMTFAKVVGKPKRIKKGKVFYEQD